jgi:hypothetical protein
MKLKKVFKFIALLVCVLTITSAPTYAYAYTLPAVTIHEPQIVAYQYQPDPFIIQPGGQEYLFNYADSLGGSYLVPANKTPQFVVNCITTTPYMLEIYMVDPAYTLVYSTVVTTGGAFVSIPANSYDRTFIIRVTPVGGNMPLSVASYVYMYN